MNIAELGTRRGVSTSSFIETITGYTSSGVSTTLDASKYPSLDIVDLNQDGEFNALDVLYRAKRNLPQIPQPNSEPHLKEESETSAADETFSDESESTQQPPLKAAGVLETYQDTQSKTPAQPKVEIIV